MPSSIEWISAVSRALPHGDRIAVIGSTSFWSKLGRPVADLLGHSLGAMPDVVLLTGGMEGVAETVSRSFWLTRERIGLPSNLVHLVPHGMSPDFPGVAQRAGRDLEQRREVLAGVAHKYIVIEGGPGTQHEAFVAQQHGALVIPIGATGGVAAKLHDAATPSHLTETSEWKTLNNRSATAQDLVFAAVALLFPDQDKTIA
jgi:hypothetical protein